MYVYLSKILPLLVLPLGIVLELTALALLLLFFNRKKLAAWALVLSFSVLWLSSTPLVADALLGRLEGQFPAVPIAQLPPNTCAILLGGSVQPAWAPRVDVEMSDSVDRVRKAAQLYRAGKVQQLILSGGSQPWSQPGFTESDTMMELLLEWGVPARAMVLEGSSRNTYENAVHSIQLAQSNDCDSPFLVTSAAHMKRALSVFKKLNPNVIPVSADVRVTFDDVSVIDFVPGIQALERTTQVVREHVGLIIYRLRGWV